MKKIEADRYIAEVGQTYSNIQIWGQYERLVDFVYEEFPKTGRRFDEIALPILFALSHSIELALKENIKFLKEYHETEALTKFENWTALDKSHDLEDLLSEFKIAFSRLDKKVKVKEWIKKEFAAYYSDLSQLISVLNREAETYRYVSKMDKKGNVVKRSIERGKKINFLELKSHFEKMKAFLIGVPNVLAIYTDFIDFKRGNPNYKERKGYLYCQRFPNDKVLLDKLEEGFNEDGYLKIGEKIWLNKVTAELFEVEIWEDNVYVLAI